MRRLSAIRAVASVGTRKLIAVVIMPTRSERLFVKACGLFNGKCRFVSLGLKIKIEGFQALFFCIKGRRIGWSPTLSIQQKNVVKIRN
jgi:hypothetical protein